MRRKRLWLGLTFVIAATPAQAAEPRHNPNCADPQSNLEMKLCAGRDLDKADAELNAVYAEAIKSAREQYLSTRTVPGYQSMPNLEDTLRKAQRAWIAFRDANCEYHRQIYYDGSHAPLAFLLCKADMTKQRVKELQSIVKGDEDSPPQ